ncbi:MAG: DUF262 domain-containing protein [Chloroflexi bacterium]|nr:DUF262 domain-containing protein [Chloroflexota bacterium]
MKSDSLHIGKVFSTGGDVHYILPHFQREYAWEKENWRMLLDDIWVIYALYNPEGEPKKHPKHFMGALVVINDGVQAGTVPVFRLVDGQQRLTTISLLLLALGKLVIESNPPLHKKIRKLLVNEDEQNHLYYKLLPTIKYSDQECYKALIDGKELPPKVESKIPFAFDYLYKSLQSRLRDNEIDSDRLFVVLTNCLQVVFIDLNHDERPYEIFESLNYKGRQLSEADLVRNYIAMKLPEKRQEQVFRDYWSPIEHILQEKRIVGRSGIGELTAFLRHYFAYISGVLTNQDQIYAAFRNRGEERTEDEFIQDLITLKRFAGYYDLLLRPESESNEEIKRQLARLNIFDISTAYPFLLFMYDRHDAGQISDDEFLAGLKTLEIYMVRRFLIKESTNYLNKMFPVLSRDIDIHKFDQSLRQALMLKNFATDTRLRQSTEAVKMYDRGGATRDKLGLVLETINRHLSKGSGAYTLLDGDFTIEHILPQTLTDLWKDHLGENWREGYELVHTLGNLTLVTQEWNSQLSNAAFATKRNKLAIHGLLLNKLYFSQTAEVWNSEAILGRAQWLIDQILEIWPTLADVSELSVGTTKEKPKKLIVLGDSRSVASWRDVAQFTTETVADYLGEQQFEEKIVSALPNYFSREPFQQSSRELSNGWWLYVNLSGASVKRLCQTMLEEAGIPEEEFEIELWQ